MANGFKHKLASLGDSLSQGFQNSSIYKTDLSFPAFLAEALDPSAEFKQPDFNAYGGIPINLEYLLRRLEVEYGDQIYWNQYGGALSQVYRLIRQTKRHWEGKGKPLAREIDEPYHNQSVWGLTTNDAWMLTDRKCSEYMKHNPVHYAVFNFLPDHALYTTARCVLNPSGGKRFRDHSLLDNIRYLADDGGIETLILNLGSNHIVGAVTKLRMQWSEEAEVEAQHYDRQYTVMRPEHFERNYHKLAESISKMNIGRVVTTTIPYVTIPPVVHGFNQDKTGQIGEYFDYYIHFWVGEERFSPLQHKHLTREDALTLDNTTDFYNHIIRETAQRYGWILADVGRMVTMMSFRRHKGKIRLPFPEGLKQTLRRRPDTNYLVEDDKVKLDTRYLKMDTRTGRLLEGGIFSLDGLHPGTIGYGLIAQIVYDAMAAAGVPFRNSLNWDKIVANDTLVTNPPRLLPELRSVYRLFATIHEETKNLRRPDAIWAPFFGVWNKVWWNGEEEPVSQPKGKSQITNSK